MLLTDTHVGNAIPAIRWILMQNWQRETSQTFADLDTLDRFVIDSGRALLEELVAFNADVNNFCTLNDRRLDELFKDSMNNICSSLRDP